MPINTVLKIGGDLTNRVLCDATGAPMDLPALYPSMYQFQLKLLETDVLGNQNLVYPNVTSLQASIGLVYAEPIAGTFRLRYGTGPTTAAIDFRETPDEFRTKLLALAGSTTYGLEEVYQPNPSTWLCHFTTPPTAPDALNGYENELEPETFIRCYQFQEGPETWVEIRLIQGPIASTNAYDHILASPPTARIIRIGSTEDFGLEVIIINQIEAIYVPPEFTGTYAVKFQGRSTSFLSANDGPQAIEDALNLMYPDGIKRFKVTNPELNNAYIEFIGPFSGLPFPLFDIIVGSTGKADLLFDLDLATEEVEAAIRSNPNVEATFEIKLHITDATVEDDPGQDVIVFQAPAIVLRPLHWDGLAAATPIDWLLPPNPIDYIPFTHDQVITGAQSYAIAFGNGTDTVFSIAHGLNANALIVEIRENIANGKKIEENKFDIVFTNNNALQIQWSGPPAPTTDQYLISIFACGPKSAFQNHTHTIGQIIGLQELLDDILFRLSALEALLPSAISTGGTSPFGPSDPTQPQVKFDVPDRWNMVPTNRKPTKAKYDPKGESSTLPPPGYLLPAVHDVIELGNFTANAGTDVITLATAPATPLVDGQRVRINTPQFYDYHACTFDGTAGVDKVIYTGAVTALANGRRVKFTGELPDALSTYTYYYVVNSTSTGFQVSHEIGGDPIPLLTNGGVGEIWTISELPGGLSDAKDYFADSLTSTTLKVSETIGGDPVDITDAGITPFTISTIPDIPITPDPT